MTTWAGFGNTLQTAPSYLSDRWIAHGYDGILEDFMRANFIPLGAKDNTRTPPCDEIVGKRLTYPGQAPVMVGSAGGSSQSFPMPGGGQVTIFYNC